MHDLIAAFERQLDELLARTGCQRLLIAVSGGRDSSVLLALAARACPSRGLVLSAFHIDHGLQVASGAWAEHCIAQAAALGVNCTVHRLTAGPPSGDSVEAWARSARYAALQAATDNTTCVLTAHHADDQMETVVQRLLGGAGPHGLAGIRPLRRFGAGYLARPLLDCRRAQLAAYASEMGIVWVEDPSNQDPRYTRNRLRRAVMPIVESAADGAAVNLLRVAELQHAVAGLLDSLADSVLDRGGLPAHQLVAEDVLAADSRLRPYIVKRWLARASVTQLGRHLLHTLLHSLLEAREDAAPVVRIGRLEVRRYRGIAYLLTAAQPELPATAVAWSGETPLEFGWGRLRLLPSIDGGLNAGLLGCGLLSVRFRGGGERCRPSTRRHAQTLKKLFQEWGVPPWERSSIPLLYCGESLAAVGSLCVCAPLAVPSGVPALRLSWERSSRR